MSTFDELRCELGDEIAAKVLIRLLDEGKATVNINDEQSLYEYINKPNSCIIYGTPSHIYSKEMENIEKVWFKATCEGIIMFHYTKGPTGYDGDIDVKLTIKSIYHNGCIVWLVVDKDYLS